MPIVYNAGMLREANARPTTIPAAKDMSLKELCHYNYYLLLEKEPKRAWVKTLQAIEDNLWPGDYGEDDDYSEAT